MRYNFKFNCSDGAVKCELPDDFLQTIPFFRNRLPCGKRSNPQAPPIGDSPAPDPLPGASNPEGELVDASEFALKPDVVNPVSINATVQDVRIYLTIRKEYNGMTLAKIAHEQALKDHEDLVVAALQEARRLAIEEVCKRFNFFSIPGAPSVDMIYSCRAGRDYVLGDDRTDLGNNYIDLESPHYDHFNERNNEPWCYYKDRNDEWCKKLSPKPIATELPVKYAVSATAGAFLVADQLLDTELIRYFMLNDTSLSPSLFDLVNDELLSDVANEYMSKIFNWTYQASSDAQYRHKIWTSLVLRFVNENPLVARIIWETQELRKELVLKWFRISDRKQRRFMTAQFEQLVPMAEGRIRPDSHLGNGVSKDVWDRLMADGELNRLYSRYNEALSKNGGVHRNAPAHDRFLFNERNDEVLDALWNSIETRQTRLIAEYTAERQRSAPRGAINPRWYM
jgi:hypothetical protein